MAYWFFTVMYNWYPDSWVAMLEHGIAAQQYPDGWTGAVRNRKALMSLRKGDKILAAFMAHRFAGYATLTSDFYEGGPSLWIPYPNDRSDMRPFLQRFDAQWTAIPPENSPPHVDCRDLKDQARTTRGCCVKQVDRRIYDSIRKRIDRAGARRIRTHRSARDSERDGDFSYPFSTDLHAPPPRISSVVTRVLRDTECSNWVKQSHNHQCQICGMKAIELPDNKPYAEAHHIKPLGLPHSGPDEPGNIVCVCPNCHVKLDYGVIPLDLEKPGHAEHRVTKEYVEYHNNRIWCGD